MEKWVSGDGGMGNEVIAQCQICQPGLHVWGMGEWGME